jgi:hypothetical protein
MNRPVNVHGGRLLWSGEHWINAIRPEGSETPSAWVSLFHTRYSPAGEGNAAQILITGEPGLSMIATDNRDVCELTQESFFSRRSVLPADAPVVDASFRREGATSRDPAWVIEAGGHRIVARWHVTEPPVIASGTFRPGTEHFTLLFFTDDAEVELNGRRIEGRPYERDIWQPTIGGMRSSCVFALAETLIELPE